MLKDRPLIGKILKAKREELDLKAKELADEQLSEPTISRIEKGNPAVSESKVLHYMKKLGVQMDQIPGMVSANQDHLAKESIKICGIENIIGSGKLDLALDRLKELNINQSSPYAPYVHFLFGKCYNAKGLNDKARTHLQEALRLLDFFDIDELNTKTITLNLLGVIAYQESNLQEALEYLNQAEDAFNPGGKKDQFIYSAKFNKAGVLKDLKQNEASNKVINELWSEFDNIDNDHIKIQLHELKAKYFLEAKCYEEAIYFCRNGISFASSNRPHLSIDLWLTLGDVFVEKKDYSVAEYCYQTSLDIEKPNGFESKDIPIYTKLGKLHMLQKNYDLAQDFLYKALDIEKEHKNQFQAVETLMVLADLYSRQDQQENTVSTLEKALNISEECNFKEHQISILQKLAGCYEFVNNEKFNEILVKKYRLESLFMKEAN